MPLFNTSSLDRPIATEDPVGPVIGTASVYSEPGNTDHIISYMDGETWKVTYYSQYLGEDDPSVNSGDVTDPSERQLLRVHEYVLKVTEFLDFSTDESTWLSTVTGAANMYPFLPPTVGDVFTAVIDNGSMGIFEIVSVSRTSLRSNTAFRVRYKLIDYVTTAKIEELSAFVVNEIVFNLDNIGTRYGLFSSKSEYDRTVELNRLTKIMVEEYLDDFFDPRVQTLISPSIDREYDDFLVTFWNTIVRPKDSMVVLRQYPLNPMGASRPPTTIWDKVLDRHVRKARLKHSITPSFIGNAYYNAVNANLIRFNINSFNKVTETVEDEWYVLEQGYYEGTASTPLSLLFDKYCAGEVVEAQQVLSLIVDSRTYSDVERFYKVPLILALAYISG